MLCSQFLDLQVLETHFGLGVDTITNPLSFAYRMNGIGLEGRLGGPVVRGVTTREKYLDYVEEMKASSLDFYATMRSLYRQKRKKEISGLLEDDEASLDISPVASVVNYIDSDPLPTIDDTKKLAKVETLKNPNQVYLKKKPHLQVTLKKSLKLKLKIMQD